MADGQMKVFVDNSIKERLYLCIKNPEDSEACCLAYLYGEIKRDKIHVIGCAACVNSQSPPRNGYPGIPDWTNEQDELSSVIPQGIQLCGIFYSCVKSINIEAEELKRIFEGLLKKGASNLTNRKFVVLQHCRSNDNKRCFIYDQELGSVSECGIQEADIIEEFLENKISFRLQANIPLFIDTSSELLFKIEKSCKALQSGSTVFHLKACNKLIKYQSDELKLTCEELLLSKTGSGQDKTPNPHGNNKSKSRQKSAKTTSTSTMVKVKDVLDVRLLNQLTETESDHRAYVPIIQYKKGAFSQIKFNLSLDVVLSLSKDTLVKHLPQLFISSMCSQLRKMGSVMEQFSKDCSFPTLEVHHFKPPGFCHLVTAVYPSIMNDGSRMDDNDPLVSYRLELHRCLLLPQNRPLLRPSNRYVFDSEQQQGIYLTNPHAGLSGGTCGTVAIVEGTYTYHHYMQDNFNDDGWGCAYRSLQTIASWFRHQGYTSKPVPSHKEIQQALVDLQDKSEEFAGSRQWIGSFEVSMCLEHLLSVTSKIMFVSSGAEMRSKGRDLLHHFQTQGTPVMIGGGVLAHTILGVDFNDQTGDIRFLILDPHYTGGEDLKVVIDKGWCGWKGADFWNQQVHYNMCMPQRPDMI
ncbi:ufm1-specific protease 2-like [Porites lutea]|uniref:ufm1-specific protease 2-like n=1 Tax=Porites lutea TaxID=51062 RepID=UPI003CC54383